MTMTMHASTVRSFLAGLLTVVAVGCSGDSGAADSASDSAAANAPARSAAGDSTPRAAPNSHGSAPVAGRPACANPVAVTYYARGGVPDEFIVTFGRMNGAPADSVIDRLASRHGFTATHRYQGAFSGFSARLPLSTLEAIRCEPPVTRISQVVTGSIGPVTPPPAAN